MRRQITTTACFPIGRLKAALLLTIGATLFSSVASAASTFVLESPGVVLDTVSNLEWEQDTSAQGINLTGVILSGAQSYVNGLRLDPAGGAWRLPTAAELTALYTEIVATGGCSHNIDCTGNRAPFSNIQDNYWSSSTSTRPGANGVALSFLSGSQGTVPSDSELAVWAVRPKSLSGVPEPASGMQVMASLVMGMLLARRLIKK